MPAVFDELREWGPTMAILGRWRPSVSVAAVQAELDAMVEQRRREDAALGRSQSARLFIKPFHESVVGNVQRPMLTLWAAVGLVLMIVCVNLSNLLLARGAARSREMALRSAIGAGRGRLVRQLLSESLVLSMLGGGLGVAFAYGAIEYVRRLEGLSIPLLKNVDINLGALGVTVAVTVLTALLFGLAPAVAAARGDLGDALKAGGRGSSESRDHRYLQSALVVSEVALACLLLVGTGLLLRSFWHVLDINLGFETSRTYALRVDSARETDTPAKFHAYMSRLISAARDVPGVEAASLTDAVPLDSSRSWGVRAKGQSPDQNFGALLKIIGPGLMDTMRTPIIAGREFTDRDDEGAVPVTLINQSLAERLWPGLDPAAADTRERQPRAAGRRRRRRRPPRQRRAVVRAGVLPVDPAADDDVAESGRADGPPVRGGGAGASACARRGRIRSADRRLPSASADRGSRGLAPALLRQPADRICRRGGAPRRHRHLWRHLGTRLRGGRRRSASAWRWAPRVDASAPAW